MADTETLDLEIGGMTCASCAARIAKRLNKLDGVEASVNYATEHASVTHDATTSVADIVAQVEAIGYRAHPASPPQPEVSADDDQPAGVDPELLDLRQRLIACTVLGVP